MNSIDHFHKWQHILSLCIYVNYTYWPHFGIGIGIGIGLLKIHIAASKAELHEITV